MLGNNLAKQLSVDLGRESPVRSDCVTCPQPSCVLFFLCVSQLSSVRSEILGLTGAAWTSMCPWGLGFPQPYPSSPLPINWLPWSPFSWGLCLGRAVYCSAPCDWLVPPQSWACSSQVYCMVRSMGSRARLSGFKIQLSHLLALCPWSGCFNSLSLSFLICNMGLIGVSSTHTHTKQQQQHTPDCSMSSMKEWQLSSLHSVYLIYYIGVKKLFQSRVRQ